MTIDPEVGRVSSEKITLSVAVAGALGVGAVLQAMFGHLLSRRQRKVDIADKAVQIANTLMTKMEAELTRAQEALAKAQHESEELREELAYTYSAKGEISERLVILQQQLQEAHMAAASNAIDNAQGNVRRFLTILSPDQHAAGAIDLDWSTELLRGLLTRYSQNPHLRREPRRAIGGEDPGEPEAQPQG